MLHKYSKEELQMKKIEKEIYIIREMAYAIKETKKRFFAEYGKECDNKISFNSLSGDADDVLIPLMVSVYDSRHRWLSSNWMYCSHDGDGPSQFMKSTKLFDLCCRLSIDLPHYLWGNDDIIDKIRYVRVTERYDIEHFNAPIPYKIAQEKGWEYDVFGGNDIQVEGARICWRLKKGCDDYD